MLNEEYISPETEALLNLRLKELQRHQYKEGLWVIDSAEEGDTPPEPEEEADV